VARSHQSLASQYIRESNVARNFDELLHSCINPFYLTTVDTVEFALLYLNLRLLKVSARLVNMPISGCAVIACVCVCIHCSNKWPNWRKQLEPLQIPAGLFFSCWFAGNVTWNLRCCVCECLCGWRAYWDFAARTWLCIYRGPTAVVVVVFFYVSAIRRLLARSSSFRIIPSPHRNSDLYKLRYEYSYVCFW
jgi:hypothetical protein